MERKLDSYMYPLRMRGEFDIEKDKVTIISMEQNETKVKYEVVLFNTFYPQYATTYEDLMDGFYSYCDNSGEIVLAILMVFVSVVSIIHKKEQQLQKVRQSRLELYSDAVKITGDFVVEGDTFTINNKEYIMRYLS